MTTERIDIRIREDGAVVVQRNIERIGSASEQSSRAVDFLKRALVALGGAAAVRELAQTVNTFQNLQNRLRSTGLEGSNLTAVYKELLKASNDTRSSVEGSVELYARLAVSSKELGVSQRQLIDFTKSLNQAIILSGASATEAQAGLIQLSQGMASGTLRGDELRSVLEQLPAVADVIAQRLGVTRGELRKMGEQGKITARTILEAFQGSREELEQRFAKTIPTLSQSFQVLKNNVLDYVGSADEGLGVSSALSRILFGLAQNIDTVARALIGLSAGFVIVAGGAAAVRGIASAINAVTLAIAANPLGALLVALVSAVSLLTLFRDKIMLGVDGVTTLGDLFRALGALVAPALRGIADLAESAFGPLFTAVREWYKETRFSVAGVLTFVGDTVDMFVGLWSGAVRATVAIFEGVPPALSDIFTRALNFILDKIGRFVNAAGELLSSVTEFVGLGKISSNFDFTLDNKDAGAAARLGTDIGAAFNAGLLDAATPGRKFVDQLLADAQAQGRDRLKNAVKPGEVSTQAGAAAVVPVDAKEIEKATNALRSLLNTLVPSQGAVLELAKAQKVLNEAQRLGLITSEQNQKYYALAVQYYDDVINPLKAYNRELDQQAELLRLNSRERQVETDLRAFVLQQQREGKPLDEAEIAALRGKLQALRDLNAATQAQDALLANSVGQRQAYVTQLQAIRTLLDDPNSGFTQGDAATAINNSNPDMFAGTQTAIDAQIASFQAMYDQINALRTLDLINEETAATARARIAVMQNEARLQSTKDFFGNLAALSSSGNKRLAAIGKAAAVTQATIDGVLAVQKALASPPGWPYNAPQVIAVGISAAANVAKIAGFESGGYTGNMGTGKIAGVVHGQEYVVNAEATKRNRAMLEAMNNGGTVSPMMGGSGGPVVSVVVNNNADGTRATTAERDTPDGRQIEVTIERVVSSNIRSGGRIADAVESQYGLNRATGVSR